MQCGKDRLLWFETSSDILAESWINKLTLIK